MDKTQKKIKQLKKKAFKLYCAYMVDAELVLPSAGKHLAYYLSSNFTKTRDEFNAVMDELSEIDPTAPRARL